MLISKRAGVPETQIQELLKELLKNTPFAGKAFSVGGFERDTIMGIDSKDLDIVVNINGGSEKLANFLKYQFPEETSNPYLLGKGYPIWHIAFKKDIEYNGKMYYTAGGELDIADSQREFYPDPSSRQRKTEFAPVEEDIERRDFTVNMLLRDLSTGEIVDLTGTSKNDIEKGVLRGHPGVNPDKMFSEDPLRMMRLIRFKVKYEWKIPLYMLRSVKKNSDKIKNISWERIQEELIKIMKLGKLDEALKLMKSVGLLNYILPEVFGLKGVEQDERHHQEGDVFKHTLKVLSKTPPVLEVQLAALLHDIGKPDTQEFIDDKIRFIDHENVGAEKAEEILRRMKFDNKTIDKVKKLIRYHMRAHHVAENPTIRNVRRLIRDVGDDLIDSLLDLAEADELGAFPNKNKIGNLRKMVEEVRNIAPIQKDTSILNGKEIIDILKIKPGPFIKKVKEYLKNLEDEYLENGKTLTKDEAIEKIKEFKKKEAYNRELLIKLADKLDREGKFEEASDIDKNFESFINMLEKGELDFDFTHYVGSRDPRKQYSNKGMETSINGISGPQ